MLIRSVLSLSAAALFMAWTSSAQAEQGFPSLSVLSEMGLSGIAVMSDNDAMAIRGLGYNGHGGRSATAYGSSYAQVRGYGGKAGSKDGFYAQSRYRASGKHGSFAGLIVKYPKARRGGKHGGGYRNGGARPYRPSAPRGKKVTVFAGGFSRASTR